MIEMHQAPIPGTNTGSRGSKWRASATVNGHNFHADSRSGAPNELARALVAAQIPDQPVKITHHSFPGHTSSRSLHEMAKWTYIEANGTLRRVRWQARPDSVDDSV